VTFPLYVEVDQVYNLACPASPIHYQQDPVQTTKTSMHCAINMLGLAKRLRAKILQASTSESTAIPASIRNLRTIGVTSTPLALVLVTTRASDAPRRWRRPISGPPPATAAPSKASARVNHFVDKGGA
jgi:hypothetical protein